jgi:GTP-binding protein
MRLPKFRWKKFLLKKINNSNFLICIRSNWLSGYSFLFYRMFKTQQFIKSVYNLKDVPKIRLPEVILCGRSNVGKSSFINSLFNRKNLAKISSTPGKTRSINYYRIDEKFYLVDLPGYGYAKTSLKEREYWGKIISEYILRSGHIALAIHLIDSRHSPAELDVQLNSWLRDNLISFIVLLNKVDKLNQSGLANAKKRIRNYFPELIPGENLILYSAVKKTGRKEILNYLSGLFYS